MGSTVAQRFEIGSWMLEFGNWALELGVWELPLLERARLGVALLLDLLVHALAELVGGLAGDAPPHAEVGGATELRAGNLFLELRVPEPGAHRRGRDVRDEPDG